MSDLTPEVAFKKCQKFCNVIARAVDLLALDDGMLKEEWEDEITRYISENFPDIHTIYWLIASKQFECLLCQSRFVEVCRLKHYVGCSMMFCSNGKRKVLAVQRVV